MIIDAQFVTRVVLFCPCRRFASKRGPVRIYAETSMDFVLNFAFMFHRCLHRLKASKNEPVSAPDPILCQRSFSPKGVK